MTYSDQDKIIRKQREMRYGIIPLEIGHMELMGGHGEDCKLQLSFV